MVGHHYFSFVNQAQPKEVKVLAEFIKIARGDHPDMPKVKRKKYNERKIRFIDQLTKIFRVHGEEKQKAKGYQIQTQNKKESDHSQNRLREESKSNHGLS